jgi:response regulator RpfG family c-di-GMP phosphodiesterase/tRNA A-37 threonylcarbamoyl transferase component Bud32
MSFERPTQVGKYEIVDELGRGGMGVVYRGHDPVIKRDVALKVIRKRDLDPNDAEQALERFKREARAAGNLHHPNIVAIYEYGEDADCAFIAMECVIGRSLRDHLIAGYRPELKVFPEILDQLLEGLEYSHSRGVIHRDIKPGNLLISEMGTAKISDFGIARLEQSHLTLMGEVLGTPFYMAPEQFDGQTADERSDVYSGAVIVYEVLTGRRPFEGHGANLMRQILEAPPPLPSILEPRLPTEVDRVLLKALAKRPEDRFRSARQLLEALHLAFDDKPFTGKLSEIGAPEITSPHLTNDETPSGTHRMPAGKVGALRRAIAAGAAQAARQTTEPQGAKPDARGVRKPRVLFVDDEERVVNALRAIFRDGYDVTVASSGDQALELVRTSRPFHVVVSDQRMPGMLGVELLRELKLAAPSTVRLLLTGYSDLAAIVGSVNDGEVFRFVSKPWNQEDLQTTIAEAVAIAIALEASPPPRATARPADDVVALVLDDPQMARATREMAGDLCRVVHAATLDDALHALSLNEVAVLLADLESQRVDNTVLFKLLKQEHPQTLVIVTTGASDSELIISLINEARIFRFVNKPMNLTLLQSHIVAALERYHSFKASPDWVKMQKARASAASESRLGRSILGKLRSITSQLTAPFRG